jgi:hypothetical protein
VLRVAVVYHFADYVQPIDPSARDVAATAEFGPRYLDRDLYLIVRDDQVREAYLNGPLKGLLRKRNVYTVGEAQKQLQLEPLWLTEVTPAARDRFAALVTAAPDGSSGTVNSLCDAVCTYKYYVHMNCDWCRGLHAITVVVYAAVLRSGR